MNKLRKMLRNTSGWFRRNNTIMAQAKDLSRQLREAWNDVERLEVYADSADSTADNLRDQLHRVARERDQEREKRLAAEDARIDYHLDKPSEEEIATIENYNLDNILAELDNEEE